MKVGREIIGALVWASVEIAIVVGAFLAAGSAGESVGSFPILSTYAGELMLLWVLSVSVLASYILAELDSVAKALLVSQPIAIVSVPLLLSVLWAPFGSLTLPSKLFFSIGLSILTFLVALFGTLPVSYVASTISRVPRTRLVTSNYRIVFGLIILAIVAGSASIPAISYYNQAQDNLNTLQLNNSSLQSIVNLENDLPLGTVNVAWNAGTANITLDPWRGGLSAVTKFPGYLRVSWSSNRTLTLHLASLDAYSSTIGTRSGTFNVPVVNSQSPSRVWFHNEDCSSTGCPPGNVSYSMHWWY